VPQLQTNIRLIAPRHTYPATKARKNMIDLCVVSDVRRQLPA
jgi:hypothetical protein